jgi:hypothetical protein
MPKLSQNGTCQVDGPYGRRIEYQCTNITRRKRDRYRALFRIVYSKAAPHNQLLQRKSPLVDVMLGSPSDNREIYQGW